MKRFRLSDSLAAERADEDVRRLLQAAEAMHVRVNVQPREVGGFLEQGRVAERAADVQPDDERRAGRGGVRRRLAADQRDQGCRPRHEAAHQRPPSVAAFPANGVAASTSSIDRNGREKWGRPVMTTTPKLKPAASSWRMGSDISSKTS